MFRTKVVGKIKTHFVLGNFFFFEHPAVYEIIWKYILERGMPPMTIWRMSIACSIPKATDTVTQLV
jgi:hypothetical protein